jgi:hypothetical protein
MSQKKKKKKKRIYMEVDGDKLKELNDKIRNSRGNWIKAQNSGSDSAIFRISLLSFCFGKIVFNIAFNTFQFEETTNVFQPFNLFNVPYQSTMHGCKVPLLLRFC